MTMMYELTIFEVAMTSLLTVAIWAQASNLEITVDAKKESETNSYLKRS